MNLADAIEIVGHSDPGMVRSHNEDSIANDARNGLAILADGMGGYNAGEVASGMATTVLMTELQSAISQRAPFEHEDAMRNAVQLQIVCVRGSVVEEERRRAPIGKVLLQRKNLPSISKRTL